MDVSKLIKRYLALEQCTIADFSKRVGASPSAVRKWLYWKQPPSRRMLGKLRTLPGFFGESLEQLPFQMQNSIKGGNTLATFLARQSETYGVKRTATHGKVKVELTIDENLLYQPLNLNIDYQETQKSIDKYHYELKDEDLKN